jgi:hypothetical protein
MPNAIATCQPAISTPVERPNTVAGLIAKRDELVKLRQQLEADARKVTVDIDHLEAAIRLFEAPTALPDRYRVQHRARKGTLRRFVLAMLRDASGPLTSRQITEAWIADRGMVADDATFVLLRKRIWAALIALRADGLAADAPWGDGYKGWERASPDRRLTP